MESTYSLNELEIARLKLYDMLDANLDKEILVKQSQVLDMLILKEMQKQFKRKNP